MKISQAKLDILAELPLGTPIKVKFARGGPWVSAKLLMLGIDDAPVVQIINSDGNNGGSLYAKHLGDLLCRPMLLELI
jgi:hypothetical protein